MNKMYLIFVLFFVFIVLIAEVYRRIYSRYTRKILQGNKTRSIPSFHKVLRYLIIASIVFTIGYPLSRYIDWTYNHCLEENCVINTGYDETLSLGFPHRELEKLGSDEDEKYIFESYLDVLDIAEELNDYNMNNYDYFTVDNVVYFNMDTHYIKLYKLYDSKFFYDTYVIEYDHKDLNILSYDMIVKLPFPIEGIYSSDAYSYSSIDIAFYTTYSWEKLQDYYSNLKDVIVNEEYIDVMINVEEQDGVLTEHILRLTYIEDSPNSVVVEVIEIN